MGDTHGNYSWLMYALGKFNREGVTTILQLGDFGIWPGERAKGVIHQVGLSLRNYKQTMYVVPGNHEDYSQIAGVPMADDGWQHFHDRILLAPRGHRWEWDGMSFVALGGAPSVDRTLRLAKNWPWWAEEAITQEDVDKVVAGGYADVMVCHDAPIGIQGIEKEIEHNPHGFADEDLVYASEGRELLTQAFHGVAPKIFLHGHYHFLVNEHLNVEREGQQYQCHILGLAKDQMNFSLGSFDTETGMSEAWDVSIDYQQHKHA